MSATEGATFQVCATVNAVYPMHEREIILMFTLTPESEFASKSDSPSRLLGIHVVHHFMWNLFFSLWAVYFVTCMID